MIGHRCCDAAIVNILFRNRTTNTFTGLNGRRAKTWVRKNEKSKTMHGESSIGDQNDPKTTANSSPMQQQTTGSQRWLTIISMQQGRRHNDKNKQGDAHACRLNLMQPSTRDSTKISHSAKQRTCEEIISIIRIMLNYPNNADDLFGKCVWLNGMVYLNHVCLVAFDLGDQFISLRVFAIVTTSLLIIMVSVVILSLVWDCLWLSSSVIFIHHGSCCFSRSFFLTFHLFFFSSRLKCSWLNF